jgi:predicted aspartyl protease
MIRYRFNQQLTPPAPFVLLDVLHPDGQQSARGIPAQIDTAADMTVVPGPLARELSLIEFGSQETIGFGGHVIDVPVYYVTVSMHNFPPISLRVLACEDEPFVLLGRDVLNRYQIVFDGPAGVLEIAAPG